MKYKGRIEKLNHIVLSDPSYNKNVWCRYEKNNLKQKNWYVDLEINPIQHKLGNVVYNGYEFFLILKNEDDLCNLNDKKGFEYYSDIKTTEYEIGTDTACVGMGINDYADEIIESKDEWQPDCTLRTGGDGIFIDLIEGRKNREVCFIAFRGMLPDFVIEENQLFEYLANQFELTDLEIIRNDSKENKNTLNEKDIVEVYQCTIATDKGEYINIRNNKFKSDIDGKVLTIINDDGSKKETVLKAHDKLVNNPIKIEIKDDWYDYETGYHYEGKIVSKELLKEINKLKDEDSEISKVTFSEFDVVKKLENNKTNEMEK